MHRLAIAVIALILALPVPRAEASPCFAFVETAPQIQLAGYVRLAALEEAPVTIRFVGHSTFRIETAKGVAVATDYSGSAGPGPVPDVVTMNHAHETHYTDYPDPAISHVLRGWNPEGGPAKHDLEVRDLRIRNISTDIRGWGESGRDGNSIFVFEIGSLCIGHLGHLHHPLTDDHYAQLGRMDVLMIPVDGTFTMDTARMAEIATRLRSSIVLPMHYWGRSTLEAFLAGMGEGFALDLSGPTVLEVAPGRLPLTPTVILMQPAPFR